MLKDAMTKIAAIYREANAYAFGYKQFTDDKERNIKVWGWNQELARQMIEVRECLPIPDYPRIPSFFDWDLDTLIDVYNALGFEYHDRLRVDEMLADLSCLGMDDDNFK